MTRHEGKRRQPDEPQVVEPSALGSGSGNENSGSPEVVEGLAMDRSGAHLQQEVELRVMNPYRTDYIYRAIRLVGRDGPVGTGLAYFFLSIGSIYLLGLITGDFFGDSAAGIAPFYRYTADNIALGLIAPVGAALLCNHYNEVRRMWAHLWTGATLVEGRTAELTDLERRVEAAYNRGLFVLLPLVIAVGLNVLNYVLKADTWLGVNGGITAVYARVFITANYFMIGVIFYRSIVTVRSLQRVLGLPLAVQPLHPDRAGGLRPFGSLALAVFYFLSLITVFSTLMLLLDDNARANLAYYLPFFLMFYIMAPTLLMVSLSKAHRQMGTAKEQALRRLADTFDRRYRDFYESGPGDLLDLSAADDIKRVYDIYQIVERMPVWPMDVSNLRRFATGLALPALLFLGQLLGETGLKWILG